MIWGALAVAVLYLAFNLPRLRRPQIDLIPNCLLTRYPICFVSGPKSLFYHFRYYNECPHYLREHGYEVIEINHPRQLGQVLSAYKKVHIVCLEQDWFKNQEDYSEYADQIESYSFIEDPKSQTMVRYPDRSFFLKTQSASPHWFSKLIWHCHQLWSNTQADWHQLALPGSGSLRVQTDYLNHFKTLAERDWVDSQ